jgi:ATP-dependent Clp protease ATP-binding subunit ClpC
MGARPLRRAIQRYIEDPLADEVLRLGPDSIVSGTTVLVDHDEEADQDEHPLSLKLVKPRKPRKKKDDDSDKEPVTVGAPKSEDDSGDADDGAPDAAADES